MSIPLLAVVTFMVNPSESRLTYSARKEGVELAGPTQAIQLLVDEYLAPSVPSEAILLVYWLVSVIAPTPITPLVPLVLLTENLTNEGLKPTPVIDLLPVVPTVEPVIVPRANLLSANADCPTEY